MKTLRFDCIGGASGDMILAALIDLGVCREDLLTGLSGLSLGGFALTVEEVVERGLRGRRVTVVPEDPDAYVHRIGRTGRIGADGVAIAFVSPDQGHRLTNVESFINKLLDKREVEGFEGVRPKDLPQPEAPKEQAASQPVFGRRVKKYSNRL